MTSRAVRTSAATPSPLAAAASTENALREGDDLRERSIGQDVRDRQRRRRDRGAALVHPRTCDWRILALSAASTHAAAASARVMNPATSSPWFTASEAAPFASPSSKPLGRTIVYGAPALDRGRRLVHSPEPVLARGLRVPSLPPNAFKKPYAGASRFVTPAPETSTSLRTSFSTHARATSTTPSLSTASGSPGRGRGRREVHPTSAPATAAATPAAPAATSHAHLVTSVDDHGAEVAAAASNAPLRVHARTFAPFRTSRLTISVPVRPPAPRTTCARSSRETVGSSRRALVATSSSLAFVDAAMAAARRIALDGARARCPRCEPRRRRRDARGGRHAARGRSARRPRFSPRGERKQRTVWQ